MKTCRKASKKILRMYGDKLLDVFGNKNEKEGGDAKGGIEDEA